MENLFNHHELLKSNNREEVFKNRVSRSQEGVEKFGNRSANAEVFYHSIDSALGYLSILLILTFTLNDLLKNSTEIKNENNLKKFQKFN